MAERDGRWSRRKGEKKYDVYFFTSFRSIGDGVSGQSLCRLSSIHHSQHINNQTHFIPFMKKRLQKKLSLKNGKISFLQNKATFFCGEKKIVEYYIIKGYWLDVGTVENMIKANELLLDNIENKTSSKLSDSVKIKGKAFIEENVEINDTEIIGPVIIGRNTKIKGSKIGPYVSIAKNVSLVDSCIENSIIREGCKISGKASVISKSLIGKNVDLVFKGTIDNKKIMYVLGDNTQCISL